MTRHLSSIFGRSLQCPGKAVTTKTEKISGFLSYRTCLIKFTRETIREIVEGVIVYSCYNLNECRN